MNPDVQLNMMRMKMAAVTTVSLLLLLCSVISPASQEHCDKYAVTGGEFTVILNHTLKPTEKLRWKHNTTTILDRNPPKTAGSKPTYSKGSESDIYQNGSLKLTNLKKNQTGTYQPEVFEDGTPVQNLKKMFLCIWDPVQKPSLKTDCVEAKSEVKFTCSASKVPGGFNFEWLLNEKPLTSEKGQTLTKKVKDVKEVSIKCRVFNNASSETSEPVTQPCFKSLIPEKVLGVSIWIFVGGGGGVVLLLIILVIVCCVKARRKKHMRLKDEQELRLGWTNPEQQQQQPQQQHQHRRQQTPLPEHPHHHHHHHQHQAGHTGPRQNRTRQPRPRAPDPPNGHPQPSPRRAQTPKPVVNDDDEQPPPLPQPRKKVPKTPRA
ncbi:T-cell surface antigen CD2-like isoform X2 [Toxotes jaculatrix]|uniref:T-cell surface antigen CD2-like isoform X2 n=1 Tax=Toxotes jaculatrix TaxID=941984 RepID=UPI001B3B0E23|nr:T-cell surface antigen CD2-like isoform X2 [Toxotes jaculatrix]XP_040888283.1 T-cell surface antigen CD2-like isoform X2 [Toxotes jaculatrix]